MVSKRRYSITAPLVCLMLLGPILSGGTCKCKGEPPGHTDEETDGDVQDVTVQLQVVSMDPSTVDAQQPIEALIFGAGFEQGATVRVGETTASSVTVEDATAMSISVPGMKEGVYDVVVTNPDGTKSSLRRGLTVESGVREDCKFVRVYFDFDKAQLTADSRAALDDKMSCFQATAAKIRIEGHTDERGTVDYNLSLGQRRAETVRRYFDASGVSDFRLSTVSYGKERPIETAHNESAWAKNRRADIHANQ
tara:strand:+ start:69 stop:821 length:753 start_codon:yes stop_codon:yes gene_type:complete